MTGEVALPDPEDALEAARLAVSEALSVAEQASTSTEIVLGRDDAAATKARLGAAYSEIATTRNLAAEKVRTARDIIEAKRQELDAMQRRLAAELEPLQKHLERLSDGISAVNLYLGRDEELEELRGGESAAATEPLVIRQTVLAMDEETALNAEGGGLDFRSLDVFVKWLLDDPEHLDQVVPDTRGVVTFMARRTPVDYTGEPMSNAEVNKKNFLTHWLLRNGERLYLMTTDFSVGELLIPTRRSFTRLFEDHQGVALTPGSREWLKAEEAADAMTRHYMKVALILQGLVDRTAVFHPLPEGGLSLLGDADYDAGKVMLIEEEERAIGMGRQPFREWLRERVSQLDVGMRVIGYFPTWRGGYSEGTPYATPKHASTPAKDVAHVIHRQDSSNWHFAYERTDEVEKRDRWGSYAGYGPAETKASYRIPKDDWHEYSFVPIDTVTVPEMEEYLAARTERHAYAQMFPALKAAIAFKKAEEEQERPFRELLFWKLDELHSPDEEELLELVRWWKTANKWHRALNGDPEHEAKAVKAILAEYERRHQPTSARAMKALSAVQDAMVLARRSNDYLAIVPEQRAYDAESVPQNVWVQIHTFSSSGRLTGVQRWRTLTRAQVAKWTILGETAERWAKWELNPDRKMHLSDPAIADLLERLRAWSPTKNHGPIASIEYEENQFGAAAVLVWPSQIENERHPGPELVQPYLRKPIEIKGGVGHFETDLDGYRDRSYLSTDSWRMEHSNTVERGGTSDWPDRSSPLVAVPPRRNKIVWRDEALLEQDRVLGLRWGDDERRRRARNSARHVIAEMIWSGWQKYEREQRRLRFIEDFGDPALWDDHSKSQPKTPFPLPQNLGSPAIQTLTEALIIAGETAEKLSGRGLGSIISEHGLRIPGLPPELLEVTL